MDFSDATFDKIKENLITQLQSSPEFKDYNFTASAISTLVDALVYTATYMNYYANFAFNESFLTSAQLRSSIISGAKSIGYIPYQYRASQAKIKVIGKPQAVIKVGDIIPAGTIFLTNSYNDKTYQFQTVTDFFFEQAEDGKFFSDIDIYEGQWITETFTQNELGTTQFILQNKQVDTSKMIVTVADNKTSPAEPYSYCNDITACMVSNTSTVYFLQESYDGGVQIYFGDNVLGKAVSPNQVVTVKYFITSGSETNGISDFIIPNYVSGQSSSMFEIQTMEQSANGSNRETNESIKINAPRQYQRQNRNVTTGDYYSAILSEFGGWIDSVKVWGGEDNIVPRYGAIYICAKSKTGTTLSPLQQEEIITMLANKNLPCINVLIEQPQIIGINTNVYVDFYSYNLTISESELQNNIKVALQSYFTNNLKDFSSYISYSKVISELNNKFGSVIENINIEFKLEQELLPDAQTTRSYTIEFCNKIKPESLYIGPWNEAGSSIKKYITDDGKGNLQLYSADRSVPNTLGTVDYETGIVNILDYKFNTGINDYIVFKADPNTQNIYTYNKYILTNNNVTVALNKLNS